MLFPHQRDIVKWALTGGRRANLPQPSGLANLYAA